MEQRRNRILALLRAEGAVTISQLSEALAVSRETVRKDLYDLEQAGLLTKVRGGAVLTTANTEIAYSDRFSAHAKEKALIAKAATAEVTSGATVFLDYGTTTFAIATQLLNFSDITVVTCSLPIADHLAGQPLITVLLPGGMIRGSENSLYGPLATRNLRHLHFDIGFFGCSGADATSGFTSVHHLESEVSSLALERCSTAVMVADHSKFGLTAANVTAEPGRPDLLITDGKTTAEQLDAFRAAGVEVRVAATEDEPPSAALTSHQQLPTKK